MVKTCDTSLIWDHLQKAEEDLVRYSSVVRAAIQAEARWETPGAEARLRLCGRPSGGQNQAEAVWEIPGAEASLRLGGRPRGKRGQSQAEAEWETPRPKQMASFRA